MQWSNAVLYHKNTYNTTWQPAWLTIPILLIITAARPAYAGTEGCYRLRMFFFFFLLNESP